VECVAYAVGSPFVEEMLEILRRLEWSVRGGVANIETGYRPIDLAPIVGRDEIPADWLSFPAVLPLVTPGYRRQVEREAIERGFRAFATAVDPTASTASTASLGEGTIICSGALIGAQASLGRHVCLNKGAIIGHHDELADYATLGPGATLCGNVSVGRGAFVGAGAVVNQALSIGANSVVGSGSVIRRDVPEHTLVAGNPARVIAEVAGYNDVSVDARPEGRE
jgi:sugar O-acyltransferase (sialic acid O-acetyltransferase NeuD family)